MTDHPIAKCDDCREYVPEDTLTAFVEGWFCPGCVVECAGCGDPLLGSTAFELDGEWHCDGCRDDAEDASADIDPAELATGPEPAPEAA